MFLNQNNNIEQEASTTFNLFSDADRQTDRQIYALPYAREWASLDKYNTKVK